MSLPQGLRQRLHTSGAPNSRGGGGEVGAQWQCCVMALLLYVSTPTTCVCCMWCACLTQELTVQLYTTTMCDRCPIYWVFWMALFLDKHLQDKGVLYGLYLQYNRSVFSLEEEDVMIKISHSKFQLCVVLEWPCSSKLGANLVFAIWNVTSLVRQDIEWQVT